MLILVLILAGCRPSPVIEQILYDQSADEIDWDSDVYLVEDVPDTQNKDQQMPPEKQDESKIKDKKMIEPDTLGDKNDNSNPGSVPQTQYDENSNSVDPNAQVASDNPKTDTAKGSPSRPDKENGDNDGDDDSTDEPDEDPVDSDAPNDSENPNDNENPPIDNGDGGGPSEDPDSKQILDDTGKPTDLPENINKVVATAKASSIVQMLGGKDILTGTASDYLANPIAMKVFSAQMTTMPTALWEGDGSNPMNDVNFTALIRMKPDVCVVISGENSFSNEQIAALKDNKIAYVTLSNLSTHDSIQKAIEIAGKMIGDRSKTSGGVDANRLADDYRSYSENMIDDVSNRVSDKKNTLFLSGWDGSAIYTMTDESKLLIEEHGMAVTQRGTMGSPLNYYMDLGGAINNASVMDQGAQSTYPVLPININMRSHWIGSSSLAFYPIMTESFTRVSSSDICLGESQFPAVVVADKSIKNGIQSSANLWKSHGNRTVDGHTDYGYYAMDGDATTWVTSYIRGSYDIFVNPAGVCNWVTGSPESFLESMWIASKFTGAYSEGDVRATIKEFYKQFYRYELSDRDIDMILGGN
jgi:ABC-type Fe3+-hydroxamate transport system substrate-binding protein